MRGNRALSDSSTRPTTKWRAKKAKPKYKVLKKSIGSGAFGKVALCTDENGQIYAIKKIPHDPRYVTREYEILSQLSHPNVISVFETYDTTLPKSGTVINNIVMEYIDTTLYNIIVSYMQIGKKVPIFYVKLLSFQLFAGLNYLHKLGIMHRDIKPENVLVDTKTYQLKICDFGSAKFLKSGEKSETYIASRFFRAPELLICSHSYGMPIDIWAAGCVVYELLASAILFQGSNNKEQLESIERVIGNPSFNELHKIPHEIKCPLIREKPLTLEGVLPPNTPTDLKDLLKQIFVYIPEKRPTAEQCMNHKFFDELFVKGMTMPDGSPLPACIKR